MCFVAQFSAFGRGMNDDAPKGLDRRLSNKNLNRSETWPILSLIKMLYTCRYPLFLLPYNVCSESFAYQYFHDVGLRAT